MNFYPTTHLKRLLLPEIAKLFLF